MGSPWEVHFGPRGHSRGRPCRLHWVDHHISAWRAGGATRAWSSHPQSPGVFVRTAGHTSLLSDVAEVSVGRRGWFFFFFSGLIQDLNRLRLDYCPRGHLLLLEFPPPKPCHRSNVFLDLSSLMPSSQRKGTFWGCFRVWRTTGAQLPG